MPQWIELPEENEELRQRNRDGRSFCLIGNATNDEVTAFCISRFKQYPTAINSLPWGAKSDDFLPLFPDSTEVKMKQNGIDD